MPIALTAKFEFDPEGILRSRWKHDMAHRIVIARERALIKQNSK